MRGIVSGPGGTKRLGEGATTSCTLLLAFNTNRVSKSIRLGATPGAGFAVVTAPFYRFSVLWVLFL